MNVKRLVFFVFNVLHKGGNDDFYNMSLGLSIYQKVREVRAKGTDAFRICEINCMHCQGFSGK